MIEAIVAAVLAIAGVFVWRRARRKAESTPPPVVVPPPPPKHTAAELELELVEHTADAVDEAAAESGADPAVVADLVELADSNRQ